MRELIDRAALIAEYDRVHVGPPGGARKLIEEAPTIEERKTGRWIPDNNKYITPHFVCSACGVSQKVETVMYSPIWAYCPKCGANMRG